MKFQDKASQAFPIFVLDRIYEEPANFCYGLAMLCRDACTIGIPADGAPAGGGLGSNDAFLDQDVPLAAQLRAMIADAVALYHKNAAPRMYEGPPSVRGFAIKARAHIQRGQQSFHAAFDPSSLYAGTFCVAVPSHVVQNESEGGHVVLENPLPPAMRRRAGATLKSSFQIRAEQGLMLVFPAFLPMTVPRFSGGAERIALVFEAIPQF